MNNSCGIRTVPDGLGHGAPLRAKPFDLGLAWPPAPPPPTRLPPLPQGPGWLTTKGHPVPSKVPFSTLLPLQGQSANAALAPLARDAQAERTTLVVCIVRSRLLPVF